jgi:hypothetical protein
MSRTLNTTKASSGGLAVETRRKTLLAASLSVISALGLFIGPAPARAENDPCAQYQFGKDAPFAFIEDYSDGFRYEVETNHTFAGVTGDTDAIKYPWGIPVFGQETTDNLKVYINGRQIHMTATWQPGGRDFRYDGDIEFGVVANGELSDDSRGYKFAWHLTSPLTCVANTEPPRRVGRDPEEPAPLDFGPGVTFDRSQSLFGKLTMNVTNGVYRDAECSYHITPRPPSLLQPRSNDFHLWAAPTVTHVVLDNAYPTGTTFDVVVGCAGKNETNEVLVY